MGEPLMLDAVDPPSFRASSRFDKLATQAREVAARRTHSVEIPDPHAVRVASLAADLAQRIGLILNQVEPVVEGALLHDLGKTRVPRDILEQRRPLTDTEFATVKKHPDWGAALVDGHVRPGALLAIRHHHEWWNGSGYPGRLSAHEIPIEARIVGIADAFTAMREVRPYRPAWSRQAAVGELKRNAGKQFDPTLVDPLIETVIANDQPPLRLVAH
jgi:putative two-component system response regulator